MHHAIISDLHSNMEALTAVLEDIDRRNIPEILCLGDVIGYGPEPVPAVDLVMERCSMCLMGNHDEAVLHGAFGFNAIAREAVEYTRRLLKPGLFSRVARKRWAYLESLPLFERRGPDLYYHASPREPTTEYILPADAQGGSAKLRSILEMIDRVVYVGHTHLPGVFTEDCEFLSPELIGEHYSLDGSKAIINVGSVGQPRDQNPAACYLEVQGTEIYWRRVPYDFEATMRKIRATGVLHDRLAERLAEGR